MMPLQGKTVAITRSPEDSEEFVRLMRDHGATPVTLPTIQLVGRGQQIVDEFLARISDYDPDYTVFMSSKAVRLLFDTAGQISRLDELRLAVANTSVVAVGPKTASALAAFGIRVSHTPASTYSSVGVGELFTRLGAVGKKVIIPRSGASTPFLKQLLDKIGLAVEEIHLYDVCAFRDTTRWNGFRDLFSRGAVDGIVFTSASSVRAFFEIMERDHPRERVLSGLRGIRTVSIGPFTADELKRFGVQNTVSGVHTVRGSFETVRDMFAPA